MKLLIIFLVLIPSCSSYYWITPKPPKQIEGYESLEKMLKDSK